MIRPMLVLLAVVVAVPAAAKNIKIEFLQAQIEPATVGPLHGLACRNYDKIVHIDISVNWPSSKLNAERTDYRRLVFWNDTDEYLFPNGSYTYLHGDYVIKGYFIARSGGMHQGIISNAFEKVDDATVMLNPNVVEKPTTSTRCP